MDLVVTVPQDRWEDWLREGDAAGEPSTGEEWGFYVWGDRPRVEAGDRLYVVAHGRLRGYSPIRRVVWFRQERAWSICRKGGAVAVTIPEAIQGFRGWRERWWHPDTEVPFPEWMTEGVPVRAAQRIRAWWDSPARRATDAELGPLFARPT